MHGARGAPPLLLVHGLGGQKEAWWPVQRALDGAWRVVAPDLPGSGGTPPAGRYGHSAVYDAGADRMIVFGGTGGSVLGDTWALALAVPAWTQLTPSGTPPRSGGP